MKKRLFHLLRRKSVFAFPLAALAALAMFAISEASYQRATSALDRLGERGAARERLNAVAHGLLEAESGERGFLLTGRTQELQPYLEARARVETSLAWLMPYYTRDHARDPETARLASRLNDDAHKRLEELAEVLRLQQQGQGEVWREQMKRNLDNRHLPNVLGDVSALLDLERLAVERGRQDLFRTQMLNRIGVTGMAALSLLALFMYLRQSAALDRATEIEARRIATERDRLEAEVATRTAELRTLARHLQTVREDERSLLARELHDELGALLTAAKLDAARLKSRLAGAQPEALERLQHLTDTLNGGIALKRRIIEDLRPSSLANLGLVAALEILLREFGQRSELQMRQTLEDVPLTPTQQLTVYRLVQEALTNIAKYAQARHVTVCLARADDAHALVSVRDDGIGFDPAATSSTHGLLGMRFRVEAEGGTMRIDSGPGRGTLIEAIMPAAAAGAAGAAAAPAPAPAPPQRRPDGPRDNHPA